MPYFDNCEICKAMKEAEEQDKTLNEQELHQAFKKQAEKRKNNQKN